MLNSFTADAWKEIYDSGILEDNDTSILLYSFDALNKRLANLKHLFSHFKALHTVAIKTNPEPGILNLIAKNDFGLEAASFEEVILAFRAGVEPGKIIFNSPVKTKEEIDYCHLHFPDIHINANSLEELKRYQTGRFVNKGLRINPIVQPDDDDLYNVSGVDSKFGVPINLRDKIIKTVIEQNVSTLHVHIGSKIKDTSNAVRGIRLVFELAEEINAKAPSNTPLKVDTINIGGGIPAGKSTQESSKLMSSYIDKILSEVPELKNRYSIITEYGQWIHKFNGIAYSNVEYVNHLDDKAIAYIHLGADMFVRQAYTKSEEYSYECLTKGGDLLQTEKIKTDLAGPLCFNGDYVAKEVFIPQLNANDIVAIKDTGANCFGIWSRHCTRTIPKIVSYDSTSPNKINVLSKRYNPFVNDLK